MQPENEIQSNKMENKWRNNLSVLKCGLVEMLKVVESCEERKSADECIDFVPDLAIHLGKLATGVIQSTTPICRQLERAIINKVITPKTKKKVPSPVAYAPKDDEMKSAPSPTESIPAISEKVSAVVPKKEKIKEASMNTVGSTSSDKLPEAFLPSSTEAIEPKKERIPSAKMSILSQETKEEVKKSFHMKPSWLKSTDTSTASSDIVNTTTPIEEDHQDHQDHQDVDADRENPWFVVRGKRTILESVDGIARRNKANQDDDDIVQNYMQPGHVVEKVFVHHSKALFKACCRLAKNFNFIKGTVRNVHT